MDRNLFLALALTTTFQCLAQTPEPFEVRRAEAVFEELPEFKASEILKPELLKGPHFVVRDPVPTASGMNQFTMDSDFGVFEASFTDDVQKLAGKSGQSAHVSVALSGEVSPRLREELEKRGMSVQDRLVPGPLK